MTNPPEPGRAPLPPHLSPRRSRSARAATPGGPTRKRSWRRRALRTGGVLGAAVLLIIAGVIGYGIYLNSEIHRVPVRDLAGGNTQHGKELATQNILLVGSTSRCALAVQNPAYGLCSQGVNGVNSDVVLILHLDPSTHKLAILSIPRDVFVPNARAEGANKVDAALYEGPGQLVDAIEEDFGIPINHYVELNFDTFAGVVDALGGVRMYFPEPVHDAFSGLNVLTPGCLSLNGTHALQVVRARHLQYKSPQTTSNDPSTWPQEVQSDLARIRRDHEFLRVLGSKVAAEGISNPLTDQRLVSAVAPQLEVDSGLSALAIAQLLLTFHGVNPNSAPQLTIPVAVTTFGSYHYKGGNYGDVEFPTEPQDSSIIDQFLGIDAGTDPMSGQPLPAPSSVTVNVLNGSGAPNQATETGAALGALGFKISGVGDSTPVAPEAETVVEYATAAEEPAAEAVLRALSGYAVLARDPALAAGPAQVNLVTGTSFSVATPPASSPAPSTASATSTPGSASSPAPSPSPSTATGFQPPTPATQALKPYDPRSCTASGGPGP